MENSIILNFVRITNGNLWHYGHFIHDFILPMIELLVNNKYDHIYLLVRDLWQSLGTFLPMGEKILGIKITEIKTNNNSLSLPIRTIKTLGFGPYNPIFFKSNIAYIKNTLNITESPYKVILIERGLSKLKNNVTDTGFNRRHLDNHNELKNVLKNKYGSLFKNVILENLSIDQQISLFMNAKIVIGQHGAGLCNIIWMNMPNSLVIEFPPHPVDTFKNMCKVKNFRYFRIDPIPQKVIEICSIHKPNLKRNNSIKAIELDSTPVLDSEGNELDSTPVLESKAIELDSTPVLDSEAIELYSTPVLESNTIKKITPINESSPYYELINNRGLINNIPVRSGLGNRLFALATGYTMAKKNNLTFYINSQVFNKHSNIDYNKNIFKHLGKHVNINSNKLINYSYKNVVTDFNFKYSSIINCSDGIILNGYCQVYRYIKTYEKEIIDIFLKGLESNIYEMSKKYNTTNTAFLHVRRGDYLKNQGIFKQPEMSYYKDCVKKIISLNKNIEQIYIFTNDLPYVKGRPYFLSSLFKIINEPDELNTLALMSLCKAGAVITNSTFGWWGAFLGAHTLDNPICVFKDWRLDQPRPGVTPPKWIKL